MILLDIGCPGHEGDQLLHILIVHISGGAANLVHDTALQPGFGIDSLNCLRHPTEAIRTEQINVQNTPCF